jgi:hypothetical protein
VQPQLEEPVQDANLPPKQADEVVPVVEEVSDAEQEQVPPPDLPDIETLDKDSDFTPFLADGVPEVVKKLALRKLWGSDPVLANLDGLNDYDEDFTIIEAIKTFVSEGAEKLKEANDKVSDAGTDEVEDMPEEDVEDTSENDTEDEEDGETGEADGEAEDAPVLLEEDPIEPI